MESQNGEVRRRQFGGRSGQLRPDSQSQEGGDIAEPGRVRPSRLRNRQRALQLPEEQPGNSRLRNVPSNIYF